MDILQLIKEKIDANHDHIKDRLESIDDNLAEHMRRTDVLEQLHKENEKRIQTLEQPSKTISMLVKWIVTAGSVFGAIYAIQRFIQ